MKVLMLADSLIKGGKERRMIELLRYFENESISITLVIFKDRVDYQEIYNFRNTKLIVLKRRIKKDPRLFLELYKICREIRPDIIHSWGSMPSIYSIPTLVVFRKPLINAMIADAKCNTTERIRLAITYPFTKIFLSNSYAGLRAYHVQGKKGMVIYNGFNFDRVKNIADNRFKFNETAGYNVGMIAAFHPRKDYETYLSVANEISNQRKNVKFYAVGDGEFRQQYELQYQDNKSIVFTGNINNVEPLISLFDFGILMSNSTTHLEGISNSIVEMMAFGKPVIASRGGGTDEIISDGTNGYLVDPFSKDQLKEKINYLLDNEAVRDNLGKRAQEDIREKFSIDMMCKRTYELYEKILK